jgi:hypothetical protein
MQDIGGCGTPKLRFPLARNRIGGAAVQGLPQILTDPCTRLPHPEPSSMCKEVVIPAALGKMLQSR